MSFSGQVKEELQRVFPEKHCCMLSELSALTQTCASLRLSGRGRVRVVYETENPALAKRIFQLLKKRMEITPGLEFNRHKRLGGRRLSVLTVSETDSRRLLTALRMIQESEAGMVYKGVPRAAMTRRCCRAAFLRASFLGAGAVSSPEQGYRIEFLSTETKTDTLLKILEKSGVEGHLSRRRDKDVVFIKKGDDVAACLALMGAHASLLEMENVRIRRESRNQANRARNCDEGNLKKQLSAGEKQARAIVGYSLAHSLAGLPKSLQEMGRLRMLHPEASLEELGQMLAKPLGKSGVNHRMRRLMALIENDVLEETTEDSEERKNDQLYVGPASDHASDPASDRASGPSGGRV